MSVRVARIDRLGVIVVPGAAPIDAPAASVIPAYRTKDGGLRARARIARSGVLEYSDGKETWGEYRSADELAKAASSFDLVLLTDDHPDDFVTAENARDLFVGTVGHDLAVEPGPDGDSYLVGTIKIADAATIAKIEAGKQELSIGFMCSVREAEGVHEGAPFRYVQEAIEGNHLALVDQGRAGPLAKVPIGDTSKIRDALRGAARATRRIDQAGVTSMETVTIETPAGTFDVPAAVAEYIAALQEQLQAAAQPAAEAATGTGTPAAAPPAAAPGAAPAAAPPGTPTVVVIPARQGDAVAIANAERDAAIARAANLEASLGSRIDARVELIATARQICGDSITAGMGEAEVHRAVALAVFPSLEPKLKAIKAGKDGAFSAEDRGYLRALHDRAVEDYRAARGDVEGDVRNARISAAVHDGDDDLGDIVQSADALAARRSGIKPAAAAK